jgi:hypothetical protein
LFRQRVAIPVLAGTALQNQDEFTHQPSDPLDIILYIIDKNILPGTLPGQGILEEPAVTKQSRLPPIGRSQ